MTAAMQLTPYEKAEAVRTLLEKFEGKELSEIVVSLHLELIQHLAVIEQRIAALERKKTTMMIPIDQIECVRSVRPDLVNVYLQMLLEHKRPPAIKVFRQDSDRHPFKLYDGHHRYAAQKRRGQKKIKAELIATPEVTE